MSCFVCALLAIGRRELDGRGDEHLSDDEGVAASGKKRPFSSPPRRAFSTPIVCSANGSLVHKYDSKKKDRSTSESDRPSFENGYV